MSDVPTDKKFAVLCQITRAQHFAWREAVKQLCPDVDTEKVVERMWELTGDDTGAAYLKHIDRERPLAPQFAESIVWSSACMGEDAVAETGDNGEALVRHRGCPWHDWHSRLGLSAEDRPGCDAWFRHTIDALNRQLGTKLRFETLETLPEGGTACVRRVWEEE